MVLRRQEVQNELDARRDATPRFPVCNVDSQPGFQYRSANFGRVAQLVRALP